MIIWYLSLHISYSITMCCCIYPLSFSLSTPLCRAHFVFVFMDRKLSSDLASSLFSLSYFFFLCKGNPWSETHWLQCLFCFYCRKIWLEFHSLWLALSQHFFAGLSFQISKLHFVTNCWFWASKKKSEALLKTNSRCPTFFNPCVPLWPHFTFTFAINCDKNLNGLLLNDH